MKIKAERMAELERFGFHDAPLYGMKRMSDGYLEVRCDESEENYRSIWLMGFPHQQIWMKALYAPITAGMVEEV